MMGTVSEKQFKEEASRELERKILYGLSCEWEAALDLLNKKHRESFKKPLFSMKCMKSRLAYWAPEKHEICFNRHFVLNHPWDSIREVLHHEMAHQFTDQVFQVFNEPPHGFMFQKACHLLRANPKASGHYKTLRERVLSESLETDDKIMLRIKKLMALSESSNQNEAQAAMTKAHELLSKYNLHLLKNTDHRHFESIFIGTPSLRHPREEYFIANILQDFYFVQGIWVSTYVVHKKKMGRALEISGTVQNIQIASYVYDFIKQYIHSKWINYNKDGSLNRYRKSDFAVGIIEGFRLKLESEKKIKLKTSDSVYPVKVEDPLLTHYFSNRYPYIHRFKKNASDHHATIFNDGKKIGKKMVIYRGIHEKMKNKIRLLR